MTGRAAALALLAAQAACSLGALEDRRDRAWSDSTGVPDGIDGAYGLVVAGVASEGRGTAFVVVGDDPASLSTVAYDGGGNLDHAGIAMPGVAAGVVPTVAAAPEAVAGADRLVAVGGVPSLEVILLFDARTGEQGPASLGSISASSCGPAIAGLGRAMAFGYTDLGDWDSPDLVAVTGSELVVFPDLVPGNAPAPPCFRCSLGGVVGLAVALGDLGFMPRDEIFLIAGDPEGTAPSALSVFHGGLVEAASAGDGNCFSTTPQISNLTSPGDEPDFGAALALGQADAQPGVEVAMGAPSTGHAYLVPNLSDSGPGGPTQSVAGGTGAAAFGVGVAFADLDGDGLDELAVADPGADVDGEAGAGAVHLYRLEEEGLEPVGTIHDSTPEEGQTFGRSLAVAEFVGESDDTDLLVVGAVDEVFIYFRALLGGTDPRDG